jgi:alginate O-acetyltransferase complex protein AlgI
MPFNSYLFLLLFLPVTVACFYAFASTSLRRLRFAVLAAATLLFYANAAARFVPLLLCSVAVNYMLARSIARAEGGKRTALVISGVSANVIVLCYFKYTLFVLANADALFGTHWSVPAIALPLGISFYTFQQIAFLVDVSRGLVPTDHPVRYATSILFFPYIISGPITLYREMGPQLDHQPERGTVWGNILIGTIIFALGLFKKTVVADSFVLWVDPLFEQATRGGSLGLLGAWGAAIGYLLQMYFDFSGYSDMAIGAARMFGILLPLNFFSPIRSTSVIEWWRRWHMTLGSWVNAYIFQPIALPLSRWAAMKGLGRKGQLAVGTLLPTFLSMVIIGAWHGGNWTYFIFGALHGTYMVIAESWRFARRKKRRGKAPTWMHLATANILTLLAIFIAVVPFRAPNVPTTLRIWLGMTGATGLGSGMAHWPTLAPIGGAMLCAMIFGALAFAYLMPNTEQFLTRFKPALEWGKWKTSSMPIVRAEWRPSVLWSVCLGAVLLIAMAFVARGSTSFVYFGF